jgi:aminopeptidase
MARQQPDLRFQVASAECKEHIIHTKLGSGDSKLIENILPAELEHNIFDQLKAEIEWEEMFHLNNPVPRLVKMQGSIDQVSGFEPVYRHPVDIQPKLTAWSSTVDKIRLFLQDYLQQPLNHGLIQLYRDGKDFIGEHSDKTLDIVPDSYIINLSVYCPRNTQKDPRIMKLRSKKVALIDPNSTRSTQSIPLPHNSIFCLGWRSNREFLHAINKDGKAMQQKLSIQRISITFRSIGTFWRPKDGLIWGQGGKFKSLQAVEAAQLAAIQCASCESEEICEVKQGEDPINAENNENNPENWLNIRNRSVESLEKELEAMISAFGEENRAVEFDWQSVYGPGFAVIDQKQISLLKKLQNHTFDTDNPSENGANHEENLEKHPSNAQKHPDYDTLLAKATNSVSDILQDCILFRPERQRLFILYDNRVELARILSKGYENYLHQHYSGDRSSNYTFLDFHSASADEILRQLSALTPKDCVVLVQSQQFRLNDYRIRIELFKRGISTVEHVHLNIIPQREYPQYINALAFNPNKEKTRELAVSLKTRLDQAKKIVVESGESSKLVYSAGLQEAKLNIGDYSANMSGVGGNYPIGEVFTESRILEQAQGTVTLFGHPNLTKQLTLLDRSKPLELSVNKGLIVFDEKQNIMPKNCTEEFKKLLSLISSGEGEIVLREFGLGLNRAMSYDLPVADIFAFERQYGMHISLGKKHNIYKVEGIKGKHTIFHIDVFVDLKRIILDDEDLLFDKGQFNINRTPIA